MKATCLWRLLPQRASVREQIHPGAEEQPRGHRPHGGARRAPGTLRASSPERSIPMGPSPLGGSGARCPQGLVSPSHLFASDGHTPAGAGLMEVGLGLSTGLALSEKNPRHVITEGHAHAPSWTTEGDALLSKTLRPGVPSLSLLPSYLPWG